MQHIFSPKLIERCQRIFKEKSGLDVSEDQAEMYLEKLAQLGLLMIKLPALCKKNKSITKQLWNP